MADDQQKNLEQLKQKYQSVLRVMEQQQVRLQNLHIEGQKLLIRGEAPSQDAKNKVWDQIKLVDQSYSDLTADISVAAGAQHAQAAAAGGGVVGQTYTIQPGDTLSAIAQRFYGDASQYMRIFNANRDKLQDPNRIRAGQELVIPPK